MLEDFKSEYNPTIVGDKENEQYILDLNDEQFWKLMNKEVYVLKMVLERKD